MERKGRIYEIMTNYERIKNMSLDEMAGFFAETIKTDFIVMADKYICNKCRAEHGGVCPIGDDDKCLYENDNKSTIKMWLEGEI